MDERIATGTIELNLDQGTALAQAQSVVQEIRTRVESLREVHGVPTISAHTEELDRAITKANTDLNKIDRKTVTAAIRAKLSDLDADIKKADAKLKAAKLKVDVDTEDAKTEIKELQKDLEAAKLKKTVFQVEVHGTQQAIAEIESVAAARDAASKTLDNETRSLAKNEEIRKLSALNAAREEVEVARLAKTYKDLSNTLDKMPKRISGFGSQTKRDNIELGIDKTKVIAEMAATIETLKVMGRDDVVIKVKAADNDAESKISKLISLLGSLSGKVTEAGNVHVNVGPISSSLGQLISASLTLLPIITSLTGALTSFVGVAGGGALGAGAVGGGIFAGLVTNFIGVGAAVHHVAAEFTLAEEAQKKYEGVVAKNKPGSKQAVKAEHELLNVLESINPATARAVVGLQKVKKEWNSLVAPRASEDIGRSLSEGVQTLDKLLPGLAKNTNATLDILSKHIDSIFAHLRETSESKAFVKLGADANKFLDPALGGVERFGSGLLHVFETASRLFAGPLGKDIFNLGDSFNKAVAPGQKLDERIKNLVTDAKDVTHFFVELGKVLVDVLGNSVGAGREFDVSMTKGLEKWDAFLKSTSGKNDSAKFFHEAVKGTEALWAILAPLTKLLFTWSVALTPAVNEFLKLVSITTEFFSKILDGQSGLKRFGELLGGIFFAKKAFDFANGIGVAVARAKTLAGILKDVGIKDFAGKALGGKIDSSPILSAGSTVATEWRAAISEAGSAVATEFRAALAEGGAVSGVEGATGAAEGNVASSVLSKAKSIGIIPISEAGTAAATTAAIEDGAAAVAPEAAIGGLGFAAGGPVTLALGAAILGGFLLFKSKSKSVIEEISHEVTKGLGVAVEQKVRKGLNDAKKKEVSPEEQQEARLLRQEEEQTGSHRFGSQAAEDALVRRKNEEAHDKQFQVGRGLGSSVVTKAVADTPGASASQKLLAIQNDAIAALASPKLPDAARKGGADAVAELVHGMEQKKELPAHSVEEIKRTLEQRFPSLKNAWGKSGSDSIEAFVKAIHKIDALKSVEQLVLGFKTYLPQLPKIVGLNVENARQKFGAEMNKLYELSKSKNAAVRAVAEQEYKQLREKAIGYFGDTRAGAQRELNHINAIMRSGGHVGPDAVVKAYSNMVVAIEKEMQNGAIATGEGIKEITKKLQAGLEAIGIKDAGAKISGLVGKIAGSAGEGVKKAAQGGLWQIGKQGQRGQDTEHIVVGKGEQVAVFTHHQQEAANKMLAPIGGLPGLFNDKRPHYMASGGFTQGSGTNYSVGEEPEIARRLDQMAKALGLHLIGISGYRSPQHSVEVGGFANDPHTRGEASDTPGVEGVPEGTLEKYGLTRPFAGAAEADHIQLLNGIAKLGAAVAGVIQGATTATTQAFKKLTAPKTQQTGLIGQLIQGSLDKYTAAANRKGKELASQGGGFAPGASGGAAHGTTQMRQWAKEGLIADGLPPTEDAINKIVYTMSHESSGNPRSENTTDSNAQAGHPSRGLMELIPENFEQYRNKSLPDDVFNPVANVAAAIHYMIARYGQIVGMSPYERGGMVDTSGFRSGRYDKPALLVGEHAHEYVIDPKAHKGAEFLKAAGEEMGYNVTPAAHQKKPPAKAVVKKPVAREIRALSDWAPKGGIPVGSVTPIITEVKKAIGTEETDLKTLQDNKDKAVEKLAKDKDKSAKALASAHNTGDRSVKAAEARVAASKTAKSKAAANVSLSNAKKAASEKVNAANDKASKAAKEEQKKIKTYDEGMKIIEHSGGLYKANHTKYIGLPKLHKEESSAEHLKDKVEAHERTIEDLNDKITRETKAQQREVSRYNNSVKRGAPDPKFLAAAKALLGERKGNVASLEGVLRSDKINAEAFHHQNPAITPEDLVQHISAISTGIEDAEEAAIAAEASEEETAQIGIVAGPESEVKGPPSAEEFLEQRGESAALESLNEKFALAQTKIVPDNSNTPENEELPSLKEELGPAQELQTFWEARLQEAQQLGEPSKTITDIANQVTSARSTAFGLLRSIESGEGAQASTALSDNKEYNKAREELFTNYGSNFAPVFQSGVPTLPVTVVAGSVSSAVGQNAATETPPGNTIVNLNVTHQTPPSDPHTWSHDVAWELGAAI